ncbi:hypothetical protein MKW94_010185 [Papaver nudicaule]|uniref:Malectin-like domain-containing protein n=1 Tax=Papaver nudicaule TaxID=74823 RepID=A0AA42B0I6_PAPNU|nr:hypothetical protein [Papaver nudicaule]
MGSGETHKVLIDPPDVKAWDARVMSTLRAFPTRKKNCYSVDIDNTTTKGETQRVLVRASFYYGNYDDKSAPPTFNLQFNGNKWSQIVTHQDSIVYTEMVYSLINGNNINVCLAQTKPDNIPFISSLEVRSLHRFAYGYVNSTYPLFFFERIAFGTNTTIRYPEYIFDRIWGPVDANTRVRNNLPYQTVYTDDKPLEALRTILEELIEVRKRNPSSPPPAFIRFNYDIPPEALEETHLSSSGDMVHTGISDPEVPVHYNAFFSEAIRLNATQKRSFNILVNNKLHGSIDPKGPVRPSYRFLEEVHIFNICDFFRHQFFVLD